MRCGRRRPTPIQHPCHVISPSIFFRIPLRICLEEDKLVLLTICDFSDSFFCRAFSEDSINFLGYVVACPQWVWLITEKGSLQLRFLELVIKPFLYTWFLTKRAPAFWNINRSFTCQNCKWYDGPVSPTIWSTSLRIMGQYAYMEKRSLSLIERAVFGRWSHGW